MKKYLLDLGFNEKETEVYLALLEFWTQAASVIAKKTWIPKSTVLFLFDWLLKKGYIRKSNKGRVQYFFANPDDLQKAKSEQIKNEQEALNKTIPLLKEFKTPYSSTPKVTFFEWINWCKKAYSILLESKTEILEFGSHNNLEEKFSKIFMDEFIKKKVKNKIFLKWICSEELIHKDLEKQNKEHLRDLKFFSEKSWEFHSSICIFENKVLLQNLYWDAFSIIIENKEVCETLKTIHNLVWNK